MKRIDIRYSIRRALRTFSVILACFATSASLGPKQFLTVTSTDARAEEPAAPNDTKTPPKAQPVPAAPPPAQAQPAAPAQPAGKPAAPAQQPVQVQGGGQIQIQVQAQGGNGQIQIQAQGGGGNIQINGGNVQIRGNVQIQAGAQLIIGAGGNGAANAEGGNENVDDTIFRSPDRTQLQRLSQSDGLITEGRFAEAVELLGGILEQAEDYLYRPDRGASRLSSLKAEAQRRIAGLPPAGREAYELQYGVRAKQMLEAAIDKGDDALLAEASRRYFHTQAGLRATYLLGLTHLDQNRPLAGALCWRRLHEAPVAADFEPELSLQLAAAWSKAGAREAAFEVVNKAAQRYPGAVLKISGEDQRWPIGLGDSSAAKRPFQDDRTGPGDRTLAWLAESVGATTMATLVEARKSGDWLLPGGNAGRNAATSGSNPLLNRRWSVPYANHPEVERLSEQMVRSFHGRDVGPLPASQPLAVDGTVLMRTLGGLTAVDFRTGKRIWCGATDDQIERLLQQESPLANRQGQEAGQLPMLLENRLWNDVVFGSMTSDGRRVFCVEESLTPPESPQRTVIMFNGRRMMPGMLGQTANRLAAYDLATEGKLAWELGGEFAAKDSPLASTYFLGPPLPIGDRLYLLGETRGEIRLYVLHASTGEVDWTQQLAIAQANSPAMQRRFAGLSPSYADGVLVCPTSLGAVVAVDLNDRSLLWAYQYKQLAPSQNGRVFNWNMANQAEEKNREGDRWQDAVMSIVNGKVLLAPPDGEELYCVSLVDGVPLWHVPRERGLYVACTAGEQVVVAAANEVRAYDLATGSKTWSAEWPEASRPSGRGFCNGPLYFVPLASAEVAAVDVAAGRIVARSKSRSGTMPGNLVAYGGAVLSQSALGLECYYQLDDLRREVLAKLKERPDDPQALASQGELLLDEGKVIEAISVLRKSFAASADARARNLLVDALLDGLAAGVASTDADLEELERLAIGTGREENYLRLKAQAHEKSGDFGRAVAAYLRLLDLPSTSDEPIRVSSAVGIGRERWVIAKLQSVYERSDATVRKQIDADVAERRKQAVASSDVAALRRYLDSFGDRADAGEVREKLSERLVSSNNWLQAEVLWRRALNGSPETAREATARLAELFVQAKRPEDAAPYLKRLASEFADQVCLNDKTGRQLVASLSPSVVDADQIGRPYAWPVGKVDVVEQKQNSATGYRSFPLEFRGERGPYFENMSIEMDQPQQAIVGRDQYGVERWRVSTNDPQQRRQIVHHMNPSVSHARADGHLLILSLGHELVAIDALGDGTGKQAKILWRHDLTDGLMGMAGMQGIHPRVVQMPWGVPRFIASDSTGKTIAGTGPATARYVSYLKQRSLYMVDPPTGKTLWIRHDVDPSSDVFGDDEYLFVTPSNDDGKPNVKSTVLRVADGERVKQLDLPRSDQRVATYGRRLLVWSPDGNKMSLKLIDALEGTTVWAEKFPMDAKLWPTSSDEVSVFTRAGNLTVFAAADGAKRLNATVLPEPQLTEAFVLRTADSYLLITSSPLQQKNGVNVQPVPGGFGNPLVNGYVYGFDRQTQKQIYRTKVAGHGLTLSQPSGLPMLVFASQIYEQPKRGQMRQPEAVLFCVDKRNGRVLYDERLQAPINMVELQGTAKDNLVTLKTMRNTLKLTFTNEPLPPQQPTKVDADDGPDEAKSPKAGQADAGNGNNAQGNNGGAANVGGGGQVPVRVGVGKVVVQGGVGKILPAAGGVPIQIEIKSTVPVTVKPATEKPAAEKPATEKPSTEKKEGDK